MSVKSKHGAGGEFTADWAPKVRRFEGFLWLSCLVQLLESTKLHRCQKFRPLRRPKTDPHNQQSLLGALCKNDLRGNASRSRPVLLHHSLRRNWLPRKPNQRHPRGLNGDVRDPAAAWVIVSPYATFSVPAADHLVSPVPRQATPNMPSPREVAPPPRMGLFGAE